MTDSLPTLTIGQTTFPINIIQGPLAGISSAPFRWMVSRYGKPALTYTEMISCKTLIQHAKKNSPSPFLQKLPGESPLGVQLSGTCPLELAEAVKIATDSGADTIDLNCGCPVKKIRRRGAGSALLSNPTKLYQLILAMKKNTHIPVSIKIRVDGNSSEKLNNAIVDIVQDSELDFLTVHGRHWQENYESSCHYEQIKFFVEALKIPVIGNGDIACHSSLKKMLATGCAGVMISRASVGQPWLIQHLAARHLEKSPVIFTQNAIGELFLQHILLLANFFGSDIAALQHARKLCKYYARNLPNQESFCLAVRDCKKLNLLQKITSQFFE